jgi:hypothetical protein
VRLFLLRLTGLLLLLPFGNMCRRNIGDQFRAAKQEISPIKTAQLPSPPWRSLMFPTEEMRPRQ